jgi:hypothetical protein
MRQHPGASRPLDGTIDPLGVCRLLTRRRGPLEAAAADDEARLPNDRVSAAPEADTYTRHADIILGERRTRRLQLMPAPGISQRARSLGAQFELGEVPTEGWVWVV